MKRDWLLWVVLLALAVVVAWYKLDGTSDSDDRVSGYRRAYPMLF